MSLTQYFSSSPKIRPLLNIGCLFDIPTGYYIKGRHGESLLNGGLAYITGIGGRGNTFKSTIAHFMILRALDRYQRTEAVLYDTEISLTMDRLNHLAKPFRSFSHTNTLEESGRLVLTDKTLITGNKWFSSFRQILLERKESLQDNLLTTPFVDSKGETIQCINPLLAEVDSFSLMDIESVEALFDKNEIGESGLNMEAAKGAAAKSQLMSKLPGLTGGGGGYVILTAHLGDEMNMNPYAPNTKKLTFLKSQVKFKRVPENYTFLTNNCWLSLSSNVLANKDKFLEYPRNEQDDLKGDTDLMTISLQNLRAKNGPTGLPIDIVISQRDGVHVGLTELKYLKDYGNYGISGSNRTYYLDLYPEVKLKRTTVRGLIDEDPKLKRALEITSELCQIFNLWKHLDPVLYCSPAQLYETLKEKGYDWDILLSKTRGYWVFEEHAHLEETHFLSTMDLLNMRVDRYTPFWYEAKQT